jgi:hypothetical protein
MSGSDGAEPTTDSRPCARGSSNRRRRGSSSVKQARSDAAESCRPEAPASRGKKPVEAGTPTASHQFGERFPEMVLGQRGVIGGPHPAQ